MEVILLEKLHRLGDIGECVHVRPGYGRNYLIPQGKALPATAANKVEVEARRDELRRNQEDVLARAQARAESLQDRTITVTARAGAEGRLYGSVGPALIAEAATAAGLPLEKHELRMPAGKIALLGEHEVEAYLHADVRLRLMVNVVAEPA